MPPKTQAERREAVKDVQSSLRGGAIDADAVAHHELHLGQALEHQPWDAAVLHEQHGRTPSGGDDLFRRRALRALELDADAFEHVALQRDVRIPAVGDDRFHRGDDSRPPSRYLA